jgi:hypothetical protein
MLARWQIHAEFAAGFEYAAGNAVDAQAALQVCADHQRRGLAAGCL